MTRAWLAVFVAVAALATWLLPLPGALPDEGRAATSAFATVTTAAIIALGAIVLQSWRPSAYRRVGRAMAGAGVVLGAVAFFGGARVQQSCTALHDGRPVLIGTEFTPTGQRYRQDNPDLPVDALLNDAAGRAEIAWTRSSIQRCRQLVSGTYFLWVPMLALAMLGAVSSLTPARFNVSPGPGRDTRHERQSPPALAATPTQYDVFISYRHGQPDEQVAIALLDALEAEGYAVAFDARDFPANESFLAEMERCVRQSRFTLALVSPRYLQSGNCQEEAMICKVLDMSERRRRLIPLYLEDVDVPIWLHGIVGVRLDGPSHRVDPMERLVATLGPPSPKATAGKPRRTVDGDQPEEGRR